jgi:hypothetical protein
MIEYVNVIVAWLCATSTTLNIPNWIFVLAYLAIVDSVDKHIQYIINKKE